MSPLLKSKFNNIPRLALVMIKTTPTKEHATPNIWKVLVNEGDNVRKGDTLFIMEVMKTEVNHDAPINGIISKINITNDQENVDPGTIAIIIE